MNVPSSSAPTPRSPDFLADNMSPQRPGVSNATLRKNGITLDKALTGHSLMIPYFRVFDSDGLRRPLRDGGDNFFRRRWLHQTGDKPKYWQQSGTIPHAYFPAGSADLAGESRRIIVTEGEFKALSLVEAGFPGVAVGGISNFAFGEDLVPELAEFLKAFLPIPKLYFLGDADTSLNANFAAAVVKFCRLVAAASPGTEFLLPRMSLATMHARKGIDDARADIGQKEFESYFSKLLETAFKVDVSTAADDLAFYLFEEQRDDLVQLVANSTREQRDWILKKLLRLASRCGPRHGRQIGEAAVKAGLVAKATEFKAELTRRVKRDAEEPDAVTPKTAIEIHYFPRGSKNYYVRVDGDHFTVVDRRGAMNCLIEAGFQARCVDGEGLSEIDQFLTRCERRPIDWAGPLAGRKAGAHEIAGRRILVTRSPKLIVPQAGEWPTIRSFLSDRLDYDPAADACSENSPSSQPGSRPSFSHGSPVRCGISTSTKADTNPRRLSCSAAQSGWGRTSFRI